jgi:hypothetical protein
MSRAARFALSLAFIGVALTLSHFGWQAITGQAWATATERSLFQAIALYAAWRAARGDA